MNPILLAIVASALGLAYAIFLIQWILKLPHGEGKMLGISLAIQEGLARFSIVSIELSLTSVPLRSFSCGRLLT